MTLAALIISAVSAAILLHSYFFYPVWWWLRREQLPPPPPDPEIWPRVTVIVAAYNEEAVIAARVRNLLATDYPADRWDALIASDGSADATLAQAHAAAAGDPRILIHDFSPRRGKVSVLNDACALATGDIFVFTDANVDFRPDALRQLVRRFTHDGIAAVCGKLVFRESSTATHIVSETIYWRVETWLKTREGKHGVLLGANGAIYALRRGDWSPCPPDTLVDDLYIPARLLFTGRKVVFAPDAIAEEDLPPNAKDEFGRRIRIGAGDYQALTRLWPLLDPRRGLVAWAFFSHKLLRWLGPFCLVGLLLGTAWLLAVRHPIAPWLAGGQAVFYGIGLLGRYLKRGEAGWRRLAGMVHHFISMNLALLFGFGRWLSRTQRVTWQRTAR